MRKIPRIAQHMPGNDQQTFLRRLGDYLSTMRFGRGYRLLQQKIVSKIKRLHRRFIVERVGKSYKGDLRFRPGRETVTPILPVARSRYRLRLFRIGHADNLQFVRMLLGIGRIGATSVARTKNYRTKRFLHASIHRL